MASSRVAAFRQALFVISAGGFLWALGVALTGGFHVHAFGRRVSSRDYRAALAIGLLAALMAVALTWRVGGWQTFRREARWIADRLAPVVRLASRVLAIAPAAIALIAIALDIYQWAWALPLWFDEEAVLLNVRDRSWSHLGGTLWLGQSAPFGWLVAERAALVTLGTGEMALRLLPLLFGIATILVSLWIGRRWMSPIGAAALVLLSAFSPDLSHYLFEAKHYSADAFAAALLPALAVWATEGADSASRVRRSVLWWVAAACGQMMSNGALLVTPACALFLVASTWRRDGRRSAVAVALAGVIFLAAFGLHDEISLRATRESRYLYEYWANELPPDTSGLVERVRWIADRLDALALIPGGSTWGITLWICAGAGFAFGGRPALGLVFGTAPLTAFLLAGLRSVPLYQRFSLWIVPALYVGLALAIDRGAAVIRGAFRRRRWGPVLVAAPLVAMTGAVTFNIYARGESNIAGRMPVPPHKHEMNDREGVRWLMARVRPGDAVITTHLAWAAIWWYGDLSIAHPPVHHPSGAALFEVEHAAPGPACRDDRFRDELTHYQRVAVYVGFDSDSPHGFDFLLLHRLDELGAIEAFAEYGDRGRAAIFDLRDPAASELTLHEMSPRTTNQPVPLEGCPQLRPARRW